jgi:drug/metabolite transporter (DMT)-like permease
MMGAYLGLGLTVVLWGASFAALKVLLSELGPAAITAARFAIGIVVLAGVSAQRRQLQAPRLRDLPWAALLGFLGITSLPAWKPPLLGVGMKSGRRQAPNPPRLN